MEENIPGGVKFRTGQTQVNDVKKVYLTGQYKQKYKNISENNYTNSPLKSAKVFARTMKETDVQYLFQMFHADFFD